MLSLICRTSHVRSRRRIGPYQMIQEFLKLASVFVNAHLKNPVSSISLRTSSLPPIVLTEQLLFKLCSICIYCAAIVCDRMGYWL